MEMLKICDRVDELCKEGKSGPTKSWAMSDILETIKEESGEQASQLARDYILSFCGIDDEEKYINKNILAARKQRMNIKLFDKDVTEAAVEEVEVRE